MTTRQGCNIYKEQTMQNAVYSSYKSPQDEELLKRQEQIEVMNEYLNAIRNNQVPWAQNAVNQYGADAVTQGISEGKNFGVPEIADWINQYKQTAGANALGNPGNPLTGELEQDRKYGMFDKFIDGLNSFRTGFNDNFQHKFVPDNLRPEKKGVMNRIGEGVGTGARLLNSPLGRGLITAGIVGATGGSPLQMMAYGGQTAVQNQQIKSNNALYAPKLEQLGYSPEDMEKISGYIDSDTFKNLVDTDYKMQYNSFRNRKLDQDSYLRIKKMLDDQLKAGMIDPTTYLLNVRELNTQLSNEKVYTTSDSKVKESNDTRKTDSTIALNEKRGTAALQNANSNSTRAAAYSQHVKNQATKDHTKQQQKESKAKDLAYFTTLSGNEREMAKRYFIESHGVDPEKLLKSDSMDKLIEAIMSGKK